MTLLVAANVAKKAWISTSKAMYDTRDMFFPATLWWLQLQFCMQETHLEFQTHHSETVQELSFSMRSKRSQRSKMAQFHAKLNKRTSNHIFNHQIAWEGVLWFTSSIFSSFLSKKMDLDFFSQRDTWTSGPPDPDRHTPGPNGWPTKPSPRRPTRSETG